MADEDAYIRDIVEHLQFLGYEVKEASEGRFFADHDRHLPFWFQEGSTGVNFVAFFELDVARETLVDVANAVNAEVAVATRHYVDDDGDFVIEGWWPKVYEKQLFASFMEMRHHELSKLLQVLNDRDLVQ